MPGSILNIPKASFNSSSSIVISEAIDKPAVNCSGTVDWTQCFKNYNSSDSSTKCNTTASYACLNQTISVCNNSNCVQGDVTTLDLQPVILLNEFHCDLTYTPPSQLYQLNYSLIYTPPKGIPMPAYLRTLQRYYPENQTYAYFDSSRSALNETWPVILNVATKSIIYPAPAQQYSYTEDLVLYLKHEMNFDLSLNLGIHGILDGNACLHEYIINNIGGISTDL